MVHGDLRLQRVSRALDLRSAPPTSRALARCIPTRRDARILHPLNARSAMRHGAACATGTPSVPHTSYPKTGAPLAPLPGVHARPTGSHARRTLEATLASPSPLTSTNAHGSPPPKIQIPYFPLCQGQDSSYRSASGA